jgi:hypothetical protein
MNLRIVFKWLAAGAIVAFIRTVMKTHLRNQLLHTKQQGNYQNFNEDNVLHNYSKA